ncbi:hypothetical protein GGI02_006173, partial [Coemansia sp. RSA 2322]
TTLATATMSRYPPLHAQNPSPCRTRRRATRPTALLRAASLVGTNPMLLETPSLRQTWRSMWPSLSRCARCPWTLPLSRSQQPAAADGALAAGATFS